MSVQTGDKLVTVDEVKAAYDSAMLYSEDVTYTISPDNSQRTLDINTSKNGYTLIAVSFIQNDGLFYLSVTDNIYPSLSIKANNNVQMMGMNKALSVSADREIKVRCVYKKNVS